MWVKQCHKPSPSHHHVNRWYKICPNGWFVIALPHIRFIGFPVGILYQTPICHGTSSSSSAISVSSISSSNHSCDVLNRRKSMGIQPTTIGLNHRYGDMIINVLELDKQPGFFVFVMINGEGRN